MIRVVCMSLAVLLASCGGKTTTDDNAFPEDFGTIGDAGRVAYMMERVTPDSVARFICASALGKIEGSRIDTLALATAYAYEHYSGADVNTFGTEFDSYVSSLSLADRMKIYAMAGTEDPQGLGLRLGLEYMQTIRDNNMTAEEVEKELSEFKNACADDSVTYQRFLLGFKTVLKADQGRDMPQEIYDKFINYN